MGKGRAMALEQAIEYAFRSRRRSRQMVVRDDLRSHPREREVAALVAQELTNRRIAEELVISERTVRPHPKDSKEAQPPFARSDRRLGTGARLLRSSGRCTRRSLLPRTLQTREALFFELTPEIHT